MNRLSCMLLATILAFPLGAIAASPYVGETSRSIKALSDDEVTDYLSGKGMGLAKAAELNGYPGPSHVLELADQLGLSAGQREKTRAIFERMQTRARAIGERLIEEERKLDRQFASKTISAESLHQAVGSIALLQSAAREIHLQAHLEQARVLTESQFMSYWHMRGYGDEHGGHHGTH